VHISGGELESPDAGDPARLIRLRYREAAELVRVRGVMAVLMINDLDAGAGRFDAMTQYTVNTQLVNNTLMNIADTPTNVQLPGSYDDKPIQRVPIIVTGNDFATLYEPLVRDGRMEKFYWQPDRSDRLGIVGGIFAPDDLGSGAIERLVIPFRSRRSTFMGRCGLASMMSRCANSFSLWAFKRCLVGWSTRHNRCTLPNPNFPSIICWRWGNRW